MAKRDAELDLIGSDHTGHATRSAGKNYDQLERKLNKFNASAGRLSKDSDRRFSKSLKRMGDHIFRVGVTAVKASGKVAALGAVVATAALKMHGALTVLAKAGVKLLSWAGTMAASLGPLALAFALTTATLKLGAEQMGKALKPLSDGLTKAAEQATKLAFKGVRPLAAEFTKANLPQISGAMQAIADGAAHVVTQLLKWGKTKPGLRAIAFLTDNISEFVDRLKVPLANVVQSFITMSSRISGTALREWAEVLEWVLGKLQTFMDKISAADVKKAFRDAEAFFRKLAAATRKFGDALEWVAQHEDTITKIRNALAVLAIVAGAASGGWILVLGGALVLLSTYWDKVKAAAQRVKEKFQEFWAEWGPLITAQVVKIKKAWQDLVNYLGPKLLPLIADLKAAWQDLKPAIKFLIPVIGSLLAAFIRIVAFWTGNVIGAIRTLIKLFRSMVTMFKLVVTAVLWMAKQFLRGIANMLNAVAGALDAIGMHKAADKLRVTAAKIEGEARRIQRAIDALHGKTIKVITVFSSIGTRARAGGSDEVIRQSLDNTWSAALNGGTGRTGGPTPVNVAAPIVNVRNIIDGRQFDARINARVTDSDRRSAYRARVGRR